MSDSFVQLTPDLYRACRECVVLTPNERLRRQVVSAYDQHQSELGIGAWRTADVASLDTYLTRLYSSLVMSRPDLPHLLSVQAEFLLFRQAAPADGQGLVGLAQRAWRICHQWQIPMTSDNLGTTEDARVFLDWSGRIQNTLDAQQSVTRAQLTGLDVLLEHRSQTGPVTGTVTALVNRIYCLAFENPPTATTAWLNALADGGTEISFGEAPQQDVGEVRRHIYNTAAEELTAAARWCRQILSNWERTDSELKDSDPNSRPPPRIGVVVPDLSQRQIAVEHQFTAQFDPLLEAPSAASRFDIGGGQPLSHQAVWRVAGDYLQLCFDRVSVSVAQHTIQSPYLSLPRILRWPEGIPETVNLKDLTRFGPQEQLSAFRTLYREITRIERRLNLADWGLLFLKVLSDAGWRGQQAGSVQFQAHEQIAGQLQSLASHPIEGARIGFVEAFAIVRSLLSSTTFAPQRQPAPIQILGYLETTGLAFTHLWITGLDDESWPRPIHANPFLPLSTQRRFGVPRTSAEQELTFARERLSHWQNSTAHLVVSHAQSDGESSRGASPLIKHFPLFEDPDAPAHAAQVRRGHPLSYHTSCLLEHYEDTEGKPIPVDLLIDAHPGRSLAAETGRSLKVRGGTSLLRDQALCPFRGWAIHRLKLKEIRPPHGFPDALDRGLLIHDALHRLYQAHLDDPDNLSDTDIEDAAAQALHASYGRFPEAFRTREFDRLVRILRTWHTLEVERVDRHIDAVELSVTIDLDDIQLDLRIDRIDRIADRLVVIDYKSGRVSNRLAHERLIEPQLPLYALSNDRIRGVLYAQVDEQRPRLIGVAESDLDLSPARVDPPAGDGWTDQIEIWRRQIGELVAEIKSGYAAVDPVNAQVCQNCHLRSLCRLDAHLTEDPLA